MNKLVIIPLLLSGCTQTDSSDLLTSGIYAELGATSSGQGTTTVYATLFLGNPINLNFVNLTGDDKLITSFGGQDKVMTETAILNIISHTAEFQTDEEGSEFLIDFQRSVDDGAPSSHVTLPAGFAIAPPPLSSSRAEALTLSWTPSGGPDLMSWDAQGNCIDNATGSISGDPGSVTIAANSFKKRMNTVEDTCEVTVNITRANDGDLDIHYGKGGSVTGRQIRTVKFSSTL